MYNPSIDGPESLSLDFDHTFAIVCGKDLRTRNVSLNNFGAFKDQIMLNQPNPCIIIGFKY
jgi:hypothetical protein